MIITIIILLAVLFIDIWFLVENVIYHKDLDDTQERLDKYSVYLDERANRLTANEVSCENLMREFNKLYLEFKRKDIYTASYTETDSDVIKYTTDRALVANAKKRIAMTIAHDIVKHFSVKEDLTDDGHKRYSFRFKIVEQ